MSLVAASAAPKRRLVNAVLPGDIPRAGPRSPEPIFTAGAVARLCGVAARTAGKWIDTGRLKGYRLPGSLDRRVRLSELVAFCRREGMPLPPGLVCRPATALCGLPGFDRLDPFALGSAVRGGEIAALLVGPDDGLAAAGRLAAQVRAVRPIPLALWLSPDRSPADVPAGLFDSVFPADAPPGEVAAWLAAHLPETSRDDARRPA